MLILQKRYTIQILLYFLVIGCNSSKSGLLKTGNVETAKAFIKKGEDVNAQDKYGNTPLHRACLTNNLAMTQLLIENGANANIQNKSGETPLYTLMARNDGRDVFRYLVSKGARLNITTKNESTLLHGAALHCNVNLVNELYSKYPRGLKDKFGRTPKNRAESMRARWEKRNDLSMVRRCRETIAILSGQSSKGLCDWEFGARCVVGNCKSGKGKMMFKSGNIYEGIWKNCKFHGKGELLINDRNQIRHKGVFRKGAFVRGTELQTDSNGKWRSKGTFKPSEEISILHNGKTFLGKSLYSKTKNGKEICISKNCKLDSEELGESDDGEFISPSAVLGFKYMYKANSQTCHRIKKSKKTKTFTPSFLLGYGCRPYRILYRKQGLIMDCTESAEGDSGYIAFGKSKSACEKVGNEHIE